MSATTTETVGFCDQFIQLIHDNKDILKEKGLDVSPWLTELKEQRDDMVSKDAESDAARVQAKEKTRVSRDATRLAYKTTSTRLDAVIGVLGKDTPLAKQAARLRSGIIKQSKSKKTNKTDS